MTATADRWYHSNRAGGLRRFAAAITILNVIGYAFLGFEGAYAQPFVAVLTAYAVEIALEVVDARAQGRRPRFTGSAREFVEFLLPAHISGMAVSMLLYANQDLAAIAFGAAVAITSKAWFRARVDGAERHVFNPSNFGIACTLLCFHWVGIAPPYMFTENLATRGDLIMPAIVIVLGTFLNVRFTKRIPLILAWVTTFALQGFARHVIFDQPFVATLMPMTGIAFLLFTFYMVTDPPTTPSSVRGQVLFGAAVAAAYGILMTLHVVFGLFFALVATSAVRAIWLWTAPLRSPSTEDLQDVVLIPRMRGQTAREEPVVAATGERRS